MSGARQSELVQRGMAVTDALWLILALVVSLGLLGWVTMEHLILKRERDRVETERRNLDYQLMRACTRFEAERQDLQQALPNGQLPDGITLALAMIGVGLVSLLT